MALHVGRFYDLQQSAYRWIAENLFPSLKDHLGFYRVGPVRHRALIFRNMQEDTGFDSRGESSRVFVEWEPVATETEAATVCEVTHESPGEERDEDVSERYERIERSLRELGRFSWAASSSMPSRWSHVLVHHMGRMAVHDEVYKQLSKEIVKDLMEGRGGRLP